MFLNLPQSPNGFYQQMLVECFTALKMNTFLDNYDAERFSFDGVDRSLVFDASNCINQFKWFHENYLKIYQAFEICEWRRIRYQCGGVKGSQPVV